jgi:hypothetical protein
MTEAGPNPLCPKCGRERPLQAGSCPRCGLVFARWKPEETATIPVLDEATQRLWTELEQQWGVQEKHDAFIKRCSQTGQLASAGRLYRDWLDRHPEDTVAPGMQARIIAMAAAALAPLKSTALPLPVNRSRFFWWVILAAVFAGILGSLLYRLRGR